MKDFFEKRKKLLFVCSLLVVLALTVSIFLIGPDTIVEVLGERSSYLAIFIIGAVGIVSTITGTLFYTTLVSFASTDMNSLILGICAGLGIFVSDSIFYTIATLGRDTVGARTERWLNRLKRFIHRAPDPVVYAFCYLYFGFSPFPNDLLMIALVAGDYSYKKIAPLILLGNTTLTIIIAYLGTTLF
jgi:hypothetical protein